MLLSLVRGDPAFSMFRPVHDVAWPSRGGVAVAEPWEEVEFTQSEGGPDEFIAADCLAMNTGTDGFLISCFARSVLFPMLKQTGQFCPVRVLGQPYWWMNCLASVEVLDRKKTDADWSVVEGSWGSFSWISSTRRLAFSPSRLRRAPALFRIPEYPQGVLFAREELQAAVAEHDLIGFKFDVVWSTHGGGVADPPGVGFGGMFDPVSAEDVELRRQSARETLARRSRVT